MWQVATWLHQRNRVMAKPKEQGEATIEMESLGQHYGPDGLGGNYCTDEQIVLTSSYQIQKVALAFKGILMPRADLRHCSTPIA